MTNDPFVSVEEMIERLKDFLSPYIKGRGVYDKDVAIQLSISNIYLATLKKRNKMPVKEVVLFCRTFDLDPMKILF